MLAYNLNCRLMRFNREEEAQTATLLAQPCWRQRLYFSPPRSGVMPAGQASVTATVMPSKESFGD